MPPIKEIILVVLVAIIPILGLLAASGIIEINKKIQEIEERIMRMEENPHPVYELYPNP